MKNKSFYMSGWAVNEHVFIHHTRLKEMVKPGDIIRGRNAFLRTYASYTSFRVTHVAHWGVFAVPVEEYQKQLLRQKAARDSNQYGDKTWYSRAKGHHKFKWCHVSSIDFVKEASNG